MDWLCLPAEGIWVKKESWAHLACVLGGHSVSPGAVVPGYFVSFAKTEKERGGF